MILESGCYVQLMYLNYVDVVLGSEIQLMVMGRSALKATNFNQPTNQPINHNLPN